MRLILLLGLVFMAGCLCNVPASLSPAASTTTTEPCPQDNIMVGSSCCLDENANGICDSDEEETTTTLEETTTTMEPTTTTSTTVTTTTQTTTSTTIACSVNADCGQRLEERVCYNGDVYIKRTSPMCSSPGTQKSTCITKVVMDTSPSADCGNQYCVNGTCKGV